MPKSITSNGLITRRFHKELRILKAECLHLGIQLFTYDEAEDNDVCIISISDYNLCETKENCNSEYESYFVTESDFLKYEEYEHE